MKSRIYRLALTLLALFAVEMIAVTYWQVARARALWDDPGNRRWRLLERTITRGGLFDRRGEEIARSVTAGGGQTRAWVDGPVFAPIVGYLSYRYGRIGLEGKYNAELSGLDRPLNWEEWRDQLLGHERHGYDVFLTIDRSLQAAAYRALAGRRGAVVALDPETGAVLALASFPSYNPERVDREWTLLQKDTSRPLFSRANLGSYPSGSSFKVLTLAAALETGQVNTETHFSCAGTLKLDGYVIHESRNQAHGRVSLERALAVSCNVAFARMALTVGAERLEQMARRFGLGEKLAFDLPVAVSRLRSSDQVMTRTILAQTGFGQGPLAVTPMQMALIASAIANRGVLMQPHLVREIRSFDGAVIRSYPARVLRQVVRSSTADTVLEAMKAVTRDGTARGIFDGLPFTVAGKTGTAQNPHGRAHGWFVAAAPADRPRIALAVVIEQGGSGARSAAPVARRVLAEWGAVGGEGSP